MSRPLPAFKIGGYYHFYNRGRSCLSIFIEPDNYLFVLRKVKHYSQEFDLSIIAYCLMPNHYHSLVRQDGHHPPVCCSNVYLTVTLKLITNIMAIPVRSLRVPIRQSELMKQPIYCTCVVISTVTRSRIAWSATRRIGLIRITWNGLANAKGHW
jgi:REP element-mobilizing transposase RayT